MFVQTSFGEWAIRGGFRAKITCCHCEVMYTPGTPCGCVKTKQFRGGVVRVERRYLSKKPTQDELRQGM